MSAKRSAVVIGVAAACVMLAPACGSDDNTRATSSTDGPRAASSDPAIECGGKKTLKASGSSAQANAMTRFVTAYEAACDGYTLNYTSNGSGAGVREFTSAQTDLGGSDSPLDAAKGEVQAAAERCGSQAWNLPVVFGPIALAYNIAGVDDLALDGRTVAMIFNGQITRWDDERITALNPDAALGPDKINVIFRSDESGTTDNFQKYLSAAADGAWTQGAGKSFAGGVGEGAKGNEGTSAAVKSTTGSITYNEWSFAQAQQLSTVRIVTSAGPDPVEISTESVGKTIAGAEISGAGNDLILDTSSFYRPTEAGAYPIVLATYEIVCSDYADDETATAVRAFLQATITAGQKGLAANGYVPIPTAFSEKLAAAVAAIS